MEKMKAAIKTVWKENVSHIRPIKNESHGSGDIASQNLECKMPRSVFR